MAYITSVKWGDHRQIPTLLRAAANCPIYGIMEVTASSLCTLYCPSFTDGISNIALFASNGLWFVTWSS